ncbi:MAG: hypothetical protein AAGD86_05695 [Pseudomonadota bacterium]
MSGALSKDNLVRYAVEALLIVFSVLLALYLDRMLEDRREARAVEDLLGHVADEMRSNLAILDEWLPYHEAVVTALDQHLASGKLRSSLVANGSIDYLRLMERGVLQDFYSTSSWRIAEQSESTSRIGFDVVHALSVAYGSQAFVDKTLERVSDFFFDRQSLDPAMVQQSLGILRNLMQELAGQEVVLRQHYRVALAEVEALLQVDDAR